MSYGHPEKRKRTPRKVKWTLQSIQIFLAHIYSIFYICLLWTLWNANCHGQHTQISTYTLQYTMQCVTAGCVTQKKEQMCDSNKQLWKAWSKGRKWEMKDSINWMPVWIVHISVLNEKNGLQLQKSPKGQIKCKTIHSFGHFTRMKLKFWIMLYVLWLDYYYF